VLNRIFVAIGVLVILAIAAAFVVPRFIQWGDYRGRLQTMATEALGAQVAIDGDIQLTLLPQPKLEFTRVRVGPVSAPVLEVQRVEAEFSLVDFIRDQYTVTGLTLDHPVVNVTIGPDGTIKSGIAIANPDGQSKVSIANATVTGGAVRLIDGRSGASYTAEGIDGQLKLDGLDGPFNFQGTATVDQAGYGVRVGTGKFNAQGGTTLSLYIKASDDSFTLDSSGAITPGAAPKYSGSLTYRRPPPKPKAGETADAGRGDFVLTSKVEATPDRVLLSDYTALPDENRAVTRLTGAAELKLGKGMAFNAVVSGGVVALPPRDATKELSDPPYELVRLLSETPLPPIPPVPGTIGLDVSELNLRALSLRDLQLDAATDGKQWRIKDFAASLPGQTKLTLSGNLQAVDGKPVFAGSVIVSSQQLDQLAALWRKPAAGNPLFGKPGSLSADVALSSDTLTLSSGTVVVGGINQGFDAAIGFGQPRSLKLDAHFTTLGDEESAAFGALLPDVAGSGSFGATFPKGELNLSASKAVLFGLEGTNMTADATWDGGVLEFSKLSADDFGGAAFDAKLTAFGTIAKPELSGCGTLKVSDDAPIVATLLNAIHTPPAVADFLRQSLPADVRVTLDAPSGDGGQTLNVAGKLATADTKLEAKLGTGIATALTGMIAAKLQMHSDSSLLMTRQLGLGASSLFGEGTPLQLTASVEGTPASSYQANATLAGGDDHITFQGNVTPGDYTKISGTGQLDVKLGDPGVVAEAFGAGGLYLPPLAGKADFDFDGTDMMKLSRISADGVGGDLSLVRNGGKASVSGSLSIDKLDARDFVPALAGAASTVATPDSLWPEGPIDIGSAPRGLDGRIDVTVGTLKVGGDSSSQATFGYDWDAQNVHLRDLTAPLGGGTLRLDATVCCSSSSVPQKQIDGRLALSGVALNAIVPAALAAELGGTVDATGEFNGTGATLSEAIAQATGSGSYTINDLSVAHFDPKVFTAADRIAGILDMAPEALTKTVGDALAGGAFTAPTVIGSFTITNGVLSSPNVAVANGAARIFGGAKLALKDLTLDGRYTMTPASAVASETSAIDPATAEVDVGIKGPLWAPQATPDVTPLVDGMKIKANEVELARLEKIKADADARAKAQVELDAKLDALRPGLRIAAGGAARSAADAEAAKKAADAAAKAAAEASRAAASDLGM
jgi:hypothetical protein